MKIALVTSHFPVKGHPYRGHCCYQMARELNKLADLEVFGVYATYPQWVRRLDSRFRNADISELPSDIRATYLEYPVLPYVSRLANGFTYASRLEPYLRNRRFDVLLSYCVYPDGFAASLVGKRLGIPVVVKAMGSDLNRASGIQRLLTAKAMHSSEVVLTVSEALSNVAASFGISRSKVRTITNGCDHTLFFPRPQAQARAALGISASGTMLLYVGRLDVRKGLCELIRSVSALRERPDLELVLLGDGPDRAQLQDLVSALKLQDRVRFVAGVPTHQVALWMSACDLFCLPSYSEGHPNVVVEALTAGRPVVATHVGGIPEIVKPHHGLLVDPKNVDQLTRAIATALDRSWDMYAIARDSARSWRDVAQETLTACNEAAALNRTCFDLDLETHSLAALQAESSFEINAAR